MQGSEPQELPQAGTSSVLVFAVVEVFGNDFLLALPETKMANLVTTMAVAGWFASNGKVPYSSPSLGAGEQGE